jgi:hypothetical protein
VLQQSDSIPNACASPIPTGEDVASCDSISSDSPETATLGAENMAEDSVCIVAQAVCDVIQESRTESQPVRTRGAHAYVR